MSKRNCKVFDIIFYIPLKYLRQPPLYFFMAEDYYSVMSSHNNEYSGANVA